MGVKVKGTCPRCGHVVETEAPRDRVTWRGTCPTDGCDGRVLARRIPGQQDQAEAEPVPAGRRDAAPRPRRSSVPRARASHGEPQGAGSAGRGRADVGGAAADVPAADPGPAAGEQPAGEREREPERVGPGRGRARAAEPDARPVRPYGHLYSFD